jgi:hypothetical protein
VKREGLKAWGDRKEGAMVRSTGLTQARQNHLLLMKMSGPLDERYLVAIQVNAPALRRAHRRTAGTEGLESILEVSPPSPAVQRVKGGLGGLLQWGRGTILLRHRHLLAATGPEVHPSRFHLGENTA